MATCIALSQQQSSLSRGTATFVSTLSHEHVASGVPSAAALSSMYCVRYLKWKTNIGASLLYSRLPQQKGWGSSQRMQSGRQVRAQVETDTESVPETSEGKEQLEELAKSSDKLKAVSLDKEVSKAVRKTAATFAPRSSTKSKNPATKGTVLYTVFEVQAWLSIAAGFLLSYNLIFPSDRPDIARLLGMWSVWMLAVPSLRARDCPAKEKEALNYLFVLIPVINVLIPTFWKSFAGVFTADCIAMVGMYAWKMDWFGKDETTDT